MSALLEKSALEKAKEGMDALFENWIIVPDTAIHLESASFSTTASLQHYLEEHLSAEYFPELIQYALEKAEHLHPGLRLETTEYLWGGARRTVERSQYTQLMAMLKRYSPPDPSESCSFYFSAAEVAKEVALPVLIMAVFSMIPVAAAVSTSAHVGDPTSSGSSLQVDYEKALRDAAVAEQQMRALMRKMGRDYDAMPKEKLHQPSVDIRKIEGKKVVDNLAKELVNFYETKLTARQEERLIYKLLNDPDSIQPLNVILMNAKDKEILYKIVIKLSDALYTKMFEEKVKNLDSLMMSLGQVLINTTPAVLKGTSQEASGIVHFLFLYQSFSADKTAIAEKMRALFPLRREVSQLSSSVILHVSQMNASKKAIVKSCFSEFLGMTEESLVRPLREKEKAKPPLTDREKLLLLFLEVYLESIQTVIQLFFEEKMFSIHEKYAMLKKIDAATLFLIEHHKHNSDNSFDSMWMKIYLDVFFDMDNLSPETLNELREFNVNLKHRQETESESRWTNTIFLGVSSALLSAGSLLALNYYSKPSAELFERLSQNLYIICGIRLAKKKGYYSDWWLTRLPCAVVEYQFLSFFNQLEREAWLENRLSTPDFKVEAEAKEEELILTIKPKNWRPDWEKYFRHLRTSILEFISVKDRLTKLLKENFSHIKFSEIHEHPVADGKGVVVGLNLISEVVVNEDDVSLELASSEDPLVCRKIELLFRERGFKLVSLNKAEFKFMLPFSALKEGDFTESFKQSLNEIDAAVGRYIEKRNQDQINLKALVESFENGNLSCEMGDLSASWTCKSGNVADLYILQYLLHDLYGVESKIEGNQVIHDLPTEYTPLKQEAKILMESVTACFHVLESRYNFAHCAPLFQQGKIYIKIPSRDKMALSLIKDELSLYGLSVELLNGYALIDLSLKKPIDFKFEQPFLDCLQNKKDFIEQEVRKEALATEQKSKEEKVNTVLSELNERLKPFLPSEDLKWERIPHRAEIGLVLEKESYYCDIKEQSLLISKEALIELIRCDFIENNDIKKEAIIERPNKKSSLKSRLELQNPWLIQVGNNSIVQRHSALLKPLSRLAKIFYPMTVSLNYVEGQFTVSMQFDEISQEKLQSWGFSDEEFRDEFLSRVGRLLEGKAKRAETGEFVLSLENLKAVELPSESIFQTLEQEWLHREEIAEIEISNMVEVSKDEKAKEKEKGKGKEKEETAGKDKGKEKQLVKKQADVSKTSSSSSSSSGMKQIPSYPKDQTQTFFPRSRFDEQEARKEIYRLLTEIDGHVKALEILEEGREIAGVQSTLADIFLYKNLSNLFETLVNCAYHFRRQDIPSWFNIKVAKNLEELRRDLDALRADVIKNVTIQHRREFWMFIAKRMLFMRDPVFSIDIKDVREVAKKKAGVNEEFENIGHLDMEKLEHDDIIAWIETLKSGAKGEYGDVKLWVQRNIAAVLAIVSYTYQLFMKKNTSLEQERKMKYNLGVPLYDMLRTDYRFPRNSAVHEHTKYEGVIPNADINELTQLIVDLGKLPTSACSSSNSANSKRFGCN